MFTNCTHSYKYVSVFNWKKKCINVSSPISLVLSNSESGHVSVEIPVL